MTDTITLPRATVQQALEALRSSTDYRSGSVIQVEAAENLCEALERPEQGPIGWLDGNETLAEFMHRDLKAAHDRRGSATPREFTIPVYLAPPAAQPEQEPVGEVLNERGEIDYISYVPAVGTQIYTTPPAAQPEQKPVAPDDESICDDWISASDSDGIAYDGPSFECGYKIGRIAERDAQPEQEPKHVVKSNGRHSPLLTHMMNKRDTTPPTAQPENGDIRALKYRIHELEGEVIGYKRMIEEAALKKLADLGQQIEQEPVAWTPVAESLPKSGVKVLAYYRNRLGNLRRIRAMWTAAKTEEANGDAEACIEYDEAADTYYVTEGWYECIDNWDDYSSVAVTEGEVTHWMPLPQPPIEAHGIKEGT